MKKNFTPLLNMIFPVLFFIYLILAGVTGNSLDFSAFWVGIVGAVLFTPLFLIGLVGTFVQLFKKERNNNKENHENKS